MKALKTYKSVNQVNQVNQVYISTASLQDFCDTVLFGRAD